MAQRRRASAHAEGAPVGVQAKRCAARMGHEDDGWDLGGGLSLGTIPYAKAALDRPAPASNVAASRCACAKSGVED